MVDNYLPRRWDISNYHHKDELIRIKEVEDAFRNRSINIIPSYQYLYRYVEGKMKDDIGTIINNCIHRMWLEKHTPYSSYSKLDILNHHFLSRFPSRMSLLKSRQIISISEWLKALKDQDHDINEYQVAENDPPESLWILFDTVLIKIREGKINIDQ